MHNKSDKKIRLCLNSWADFRVLRNTLSEEECLSALEIESVTRKRPRLIDDLIRWHLKKRRVRLYKEYLDAH